MSGYIFKTASSASEAQAVHKLNYRTFVEEIPQHPVNDKRVLIDRFDSENTYIIALHNQELIGMVAVRGQRPFSLDSKLDRLDSYLPAHENLCEIRLLSVDKAHRNGRVFKGLMDELLRHAEEFRYDLAVISGTVRQLKLYRNMGFVPFGPLVGSADAMFQPMYISKRAFNDRLEEMPSDRAGMTSGCLPLNFLPGPVSIRSNVRQALSAPPVSHRSEGFIKRLQRIKSRIFKLTGARYTEVLLGSGTLANDAIAWQLRQLDAPGLVLTTGEFGNRLVDHARRADLDIKVIEMSAADFAGSDACNDILARHPQTKWLWTVHCETSTGAMINLTTFRSICRERDVKLCVDAISTFGVMPLDLRDVYFASAVSGKAVGAYPGLALVFYSHQLDPPRYGVPRYLDLNVYAAHNGIPYTHSSNLVEALDEALKSYPSASSFEKLLHRAEWLRGELSKMDCKIVSADEHTSPAVVTISLPGYIDSRAFGDRLADNGCLLSYQSEYLVARNRIQICMMSRVKWKNLQVLLGHMQSNLKRLH